MKTKENPVFAETVRRLKTWITDRWKESEATKRDLRPGLASHFMWIARITETYNKIKLRGRPEEFLKNKEYPQIWTFLFMAGRL